MALEISSRPRDFSSPWPLTDNGPGSDIDYMGKKVTLRPNMTVIEYMRLMYGPVPYGSVTANFNFLRRDSVDKKYTSASMDPFTMPGNVMTIKPRLRSSVTSLIAVLTSQWTAFGLPLKDDPERQLKGIPDLEKGTELILHKLANADSGSPTGSDATPINLSSLEEISYIASNIAILLKTALPRVVRPGWWLVSYAGNEDDISKPLGQGLEAFAAILNYCLNEEAEHWKRVYDKACKSLGDPLDTAVGYPFFTSEVSADGTPLSKIQVLARYKNLAHPDKPLDHASLLERVKSRAKTSFERDWPLAIGCIRRIQQGNKEQHAWRSSASGLKYDHDGRGYNTVRVAWAAPYLLNLCLTPLQLNMKALRMMIPGLYHDGDEKRMETSLIRSSRSIPLESDFSNYDRTIPVVLMDRICALIAGRMPHGTAHASISRAAWKDVSVIWPDHTTMEGTGWVFRPKSLALLSGLKITSEIGSLSTYVVMLETRIRAGKSIEQVIKEETASISAHLRKNLKSPPVVLIQSDDILFLSTNPKELLSLTTAFKAVSSSVGMKAEVVIGDKFLMRHMTQGRDLPVISRWWQNTLASETASTDPLIFLVGFIARMDGMLGFKCVDPFLTGRKQGIPSYQLPFLKLIWKDMLSWFEAAVVPHPECIALTKQILSGLEALPSPEAASVRTAGASSRVHLSAALVQTIDDARVRSGIALAKRDLAILAASQAKSSLASSEVFKFLSRLYNDRYSPASANMLDSLTSRSSELASVVKTIEGKERQFALFACNQIGINPFQMMK